MVEKLDLLLVGGHVLDPYTGRDGRYDIGIKGGRVAGLYPGGGILPAAAEVIDVDGDYLSPGWIDLHVHVADGAVIGIDADTVGVRQGVSMQGVRDREPFPALWNMSSARRRRVSLRGSMSRVQGSLTDYRSLPI